MSSKSTNYQTTMEVIIMYRVFNRITGTAKQFKSRKAARTYADKTDFNYGAVICSVSLLSGGN